RMMRRKRTASPSCLLRPRPASRENIGSKITFRVDGGTEPELTLQPYPTYYEYHNGMLVHTYRQAGDPRANFNDHPYPFGTVPSIRTGGTTPGGRDGDAESEADPSA